jgi:hypothetical protein
MTLNSMLEIIFSFGAPESPQPFLCLLVVSLKRGAIFWGILKVEKQVLSLMSGVCFWYWVMLCGALPSRYPRSKTVI